jgi:cation/acetate symporter
VNYLANPTAIAVFAFFVAVVLGISFFLGRRAKSAKGYYAAHGEIHWFVNGFAFAGDYLSAASFLGICGLIAFYGYDGFLYSIGYLAGWIVALFVIAEPLKRMGRYTFADALDNKFNSRGIKLTAAISTLLVSMFYLIPQMVGAGVLVKPLLGLPHWAGVVLVGVVVILIVVTAGMVSTTWVQFIKGSLLVIFCTILVFMILHRGLDVHDDPRLNIPVVPGEVELLKPVGQWAAQPDFSRFKMPDGRTLTEYHRVVRISGPEKNTEHATTYYAQAQTVTIRTDGQKLIDGLPSGTREGENDLKPVGRIVSLPGGISKTGPLGPFSFLSTIQASTVETWSSKKISEQDGSQTTIYYPTWAKGADLLTPGIYFKGIKSAKITDKLDFISLMLALFCGTASLPHILIRYYTVKDEAAVRKSTIVGIAAIGFFYVLTLYLGLGAMTSGALDPTDNNMSAPLLAHSFSNLLFAIISAIAFTTVLGTVSGLIIAASGAIAHDLMQNVMKVEMTDHQKVNAGKVVAVVVGIIAMGLGIAFKKLNVSFLVGWAFNIAASANLPSLVMLLFWKRTTKQGITAAITVGLLSSLVWVLLSKEAFINVYGIAGHPGKVPFSQPGLITIPLGFLVLIIVSLCTPRRKAVRRGFEPVQAK